MKKTLASILVILSFIFSSTSVASAAKLNSRCSEIDWLKGSKVKIGSTKAQCVAGPDDYYWIATNQISADAAAAGPQENRRRLAQKSSQTVPQARTTIVPNVLGWPSNSAETKLRQYGLRTIRLVRGSGDDSQAVCAMSNAGVITWMSIGPGYKVPMNTLITIHSNC